MRVEKIVRDDEVLKIVDDAVHEETVRLGSALGAYRRTGHALGPPGDILAQITGSGSTGWSVRLTRNPHEREGTGARQATISRAVTPEGRATSALAEGVRRLVDPVDRMLRRDAAIMTLSDEQLVADGFLNPKWSMSAHPLLVAMMRADGYDPQDLLNPRYRMSGDPTSATPIMTNVERRCINTFADASVNDSSDTLKGYIHLDVLDVEVYGHRKYVGDGRQEITYMSGRQGRPLLCISVGTMPPETLLPSLKGMLLDDVVRHPAWGGTLPGIRIEEATNHDGYFTLVLSPALEPLAEAPEGMDVSWRSISA